MPPKLVQKLLIAETPDGLWPWVADPDRVQLWNEKLESHTAPSLSSLHQGSTYTVRYRMRAGAQAVDNRAEVVTWEPPTRITVRYYGGDLGRDGWVVESASLDSVSGGTLVRRTVEFNVPRLPWFVRLLMRVIFRFGKPKGESDLEALERVMREWNEAPAR